MLKHYNVFKTLPQDFLSRIHMACVTENDSIKALIVDCDDEVYAIGKDNSDTSEPVRLDAICKMEVYDFSFGSGHVAALTKDGQVFMWGQNACHQCGNGGKEYVKTPTQISFQEEKVKNILCGWDHTLALTESGSVYTWGRNILAQCGTGTRINVKFPEKLMIGKVKSMACGAGHSLVLLENGQVYGWGENGDGQLGLGRETHCELSPALVSEGLTRVKKIVCGSYHTIALSTDGCLYTWGYNDYGQLGLGHTERRHTPQKLESYSGGPFTDVAALWCKDISVAFKENGKCFIWGQNSHGDWTVPTEIKADSFNDAFALHVLSIPVTFERIFFDKVDYKSAQNESIHLTIGKISFNTKHIIGRGALGTRVFRGLFEGNQPVAVKRTDNFEIADREIEFLQKLANQNLVRYYATESDGIFRYIAIEMADMSFADFIERKRNGEFRDMNDIILLEEISKGLAYLHSRDIIHCDIRPQNALISAPMRPHGNRRAMLTDFSVSNEQTSKNKLLSLSSTVAEGWIAREVLQSEESIFIPTKAIDVFALGCLFYYMLNDGQHPFGDRFHRQGNVYDGRYDINALKKRESLCKYHLIEATIDGDPAKRPTIDAVLKHPMFWDPKKSLLFIENASNRLGQKKEGLLLDSLESRATDVTNRNWMRILTEELQSDLKKSRNYNESSVKDLLRAIRNKYQHYDELSKGVKQSLGLKPDGFASYFTQKFPLLLAYTYIVLQQCKAENDFKDYYSDSFDFKPLPTIKSDALFLVV